MNVEFKKIEVFDVAGEKVMFPVLLEVNFGPDNTRLVSAFPDFYNDIFVALFLQDIAGRPVTPL